MRFLPYGDTGLLVDEAADPIGLRATAQGAPGVVDAVPAARTLLVEFDPSRTTRERLVELLGAATPRQHVPSGVATIDVLVRYDGPDLDAVAQEAGISRAEVIQRHSSATYTVAFGGFSPGFAYLTGLDPLLQVRRLERPRTSVPAGSVGIAGEYTGIYPRVSPGGWRLIATTDARLWDTSRQPPALLQPGAHVQFVAT